MKSTAAVEVEVLPKGGADTVVKNFKTQLKEAKNEAQLMVQTFGEFSAEALAAQKKVAELADKMEDFNDRVKALNPDKFAKVQTIVNGVASGFAAAQGAMALFGSESEDLQKTLVKVQGAMALAQGLEGLGKVQQQFTTLAKDISGPVIAAFGKLKGAIGSAFAVTGIGVAIAAIVLLYQKYTETTEKLGKERAKQEKINQTLIDVQNESVKIQNEEVESIGKLLLITKLENVSKEDKKRAIKSIQEIYPSYLKNQDLDKVSTEQIKTANDQLIITIGKRARAQAALQELNKIYTRQVQIDLSLQSQNNNLLQQRIDLTNKGLGPADIEKQIGNQQKLQDIGNAKLNQELADLKIQEQKIQNYISENKLTDYLADTQIKNKEKVDKKDEDIAQNKLERDAKLAALNQQTLSQQVEAADKEFSVTVKQLKKQGFTQLEINKLRDATLEKVREDFYSKEKADAEKAAADLKSSKEKFIAADLQQIKEQFQKEIDYVQERDAKLLDQTSTKEKIAAIELKSLQAQYDEKKRLGVTDLALAEQISQKKTEFTDKEIAEQQKLADKEKEIQAAKFKAVNDSLNAITDIYSAFASSSEEDQKKAFEVNKAAQIAQAIVNTYQGVTAALTTVPLFPGQQFITAGLALATGIAAVKKISDTQYQSKSVDKTNPSQASGQGQMQSFAPRMSTLNTNESLTQNRKVFVTEGDITRTQRRVSNNQAISVVE